ncbi:xin actin-binding repeat-containing protein 2 isoform X8 [Fopius arisanus]|uniref:Xin actin-binding repeat-containing protein 2 isoform X8 n=1 Tax=Fopius arisanus TaxID=64838 RepID=A0A9R1TFA6_9HYME|nr:PREDICTED: xin actin-binding repeat-containing protein 2 isoform X8 [Fopius arisanus]
MAELLSKKSSNVVSTKNDVCSVKSNNGLIDLDITPSNNQLLNLCDDEDDLILTNNTKNELTPEDKSLQELIESELALRICSEPSPEVEMLATEDDHHQPSISIKKIVIEPRQDLLDINAEFIGAEIDHYNIVEDPYTYRNGHTSPIITDSHSPESKEPLDLIDADLDQVYTDNLRGATIRSSGSATESLLDLENYGDLIQNCQTEQSVTADPFEMPPEVTNDLDQDLNPIDFDKTQPYELESEVDNGKPHHVDPEEDELGLGELVSEVYQPDERKKSARDMWMDEIDRVDQVHHISDNLALHPSSEITYEYSYGLSPGFETISAPEEPQTDDYEEHCQENIENNVDILEFETEVLEPGELLGKTSGISKDAGVFGPLMTGERDPVMVDDQFSNEEIKETKIDEQDFHIGEVDEVEKKNEITADISPSQDDVGSYIINPSKQFNEEVLCRTTTDPILLEERTDKSQIVEENEVFARSEELAETDKANPTKKDSVPEKCLSSPSVAPLATPDDESSDLSNSCDSENHEEVITTSTVTSSTSKSITKTKKKKIEGSSNDALQISTPKTKKTKKSKKNDLEKENISVNVNAEEKSMHSNQRVQHYPEEFSDEDDLSNVNVKSLKSSFNKFDALTKKNVLHVRSVDASKVHQQLNSVGQNGDANPNCRSCGKVVFQMEQTKAEGLVWHKNCFRCVQCSKQLNVDNYESNECILYCKAHFKELFQPKPVEESDQPVRPRKPEMIIRENQPKELPPDVVRASDKPDLGLEELSSLNVKSRFQVFEKSEAEKNEIERSPSQVAVKRSPSILSKLAKFQAKGMDIGVADESLNGIPYEETSESEEEEEEEETEDSEIVKSKRTTRERPMSFSKMDDMKNRWEVTSQQGRRESQREARKEEMAGIRSRLFMGKQGKMKEMYQQAVATSEKVTKINPAEEIQNSTLARSIKERFERGEPIIVDEDETDNKPKAEKPDEDVIAAGISRKSRSLFLELDATAAKTGRPVTPVNPKTPTETPRRARDAFMGRQVSDDVIRSTDTTAEIQVETSDITNKFKFFETYREPEKMRKQFRITPPRDGQVKVNSPEREIYRDPDVVRADDRVDEVVHTDTARKMLSIFRQMEEKATKEDLPDGPKPLKRFTPPPEDKYARPTASDSEDEEEEEGEESGSDEERDPNYVRASDKVEDEFLKQAQNAAKAKTLRAKFEQWETTDGKTTSHHVAEMDLAQTADGEQQSIESARSLRARFESLGSQPAEAPRAAKVKVNRFVEIQTACTDVCESCEKKVYPLEKVETNNKIFHKHCFRCLQCNCVLRMDTFTLNNGKLYCIPHFKQLFIARGNYDEGFGVDPHKNKWSTTTNSSTTAPTTIVANGGATPVANQV